MSAEIRDPIHGFIKLDEWEWEIINQPAFQRLRRIKQLAWTDMVYPGATHSRFQHSLGVMHVATRLFDTIRQRNYDLLKSEFKYEDAGFDRQKKLVRLAALLHDIGHGPFSHAVEEILPVNSASGKRYEHEQYSAAIVEHTLKDVIENHPANKNNYHITVNEIKDFFLGKPASGKSLVWRDLVSGQMDADRMDYLLRDAYHAGVSYGKYDLDRLSVTVSLCEDGESDTYRIGVDEDGIHAVEGLLLARYMMFTQVYFHKTRVIYDYHVIEALKEILRDTGGFLPSPDKRENVHAYLEWDDWRVLGALAEGKAGCHGKILRDRNHYRRIYETPEVPSRQELERFEEAYDLVKAFGAVKREAGKSWYKFEKEEILLSPSRGGGLTSPCPLSHQSPVVNGLQTIKQTRIYVPSERRQEAEEKVKGLKK